jgi:HK97 family phage portal protein
MMRGLFGSIVGKDATTASSPASWFIDWVFGGEQSSSGVRVTPETAMHQDGVWSCVRVKSEDMGKLPCFMYRRLPKGGKERATDHPYYSLVHDAPNPQMTAFEFRQMMQAHLDLRGNAYALKEFDVRGRIVALWPLLPTWVQVLVTPDRRDVFYRITIPGQAAWEPIPAEGIFHLRGMSFDGIVGLSPIAYHRETIGLAIGAERYGAAFFGNNAQPKGGLKLPSTIGPEAAKVLRDSWEERHRGVENAHKLAIFDGGMEWVATGLSNEDAQYVDVRKMQNQAIYRIYRMPPHKVGDLDKATFSNIEQQSLEYVTDCLLSECKRWEQTMFRDLLSAQEQKEYFFEFLLDILLRGDFKSRMEGYAIARNWSIFNANDCLEKENMNHYPAGDIYLQPLNMVEAGSPPQPPTTNPTAPDLSPGAAKVLLGQLQILVARQDEEAAREPAGQGLQPPGAKHINGSAISEH